jgi:hypothetical protein
MRIQTAEQLTRLGAGLARLVMIVMAVAIVLTGATLISTPLAIPFVVGLWLGAAAILALGVWGPLPGA